MSKGPLGNECPQCGSDSIERDDYDEDGDTVREDWACDRCGCHWHRVMTVALVEITVDGDTAE